jgi:hypothetical protein
MPPSVLSTLARDVLVLFLCLFNRLRSRSVHTSARWTCCSGYCAYGNVKTATNLVLYPPIQHFRKYSHLTNIDSSCETVPAVRPSCFLPSSCLRCSADFGSTDPNRHFVVSHSSQYRRFAFRTSSQSTAKPATTVSCKKQRAQRARYECGNRTPTEARMTRRTITSTIIGHNVQRMELPSTHQRRQNQSPSVQKLA